MPKYLIEVRYNAEGARGVKREGGTARRDAAAKVAEALGGKLEAFYFAFGEVDVLRNLSISPTRKPRSRV